MQSAKIFPLLLVLIHFLSCQRSNQSTGFDLRGSSKICIINQTNDSLRIALESWTIVPFKEQDLDTSIAPLATLSYPLKTQGKKHYSLWLNQTKYRLFTQPQAKDTVAIQDSPASDSVVFAGDSQIINRFLLDKQVAFGSADADYRPRGSITRESNDFDRIIQVNDSITRVHLAYLQQLTTDISIWYTKFEIDRLQYLNEGLKSNSFFYRRALLSKTDTLPANFINNIGNSTTVQNPNILGSLWYYQFLRDYMFLKTSVHLYSSIPATAQADQDRTDSLFATVQEELTGLVKDVFLAASISTIIDRRRHVLDTHWISLVDDKGLQNFLHDYLVTHSRLPIGAEVPYFSLPTADSIYYEPKSFQAQVVLINFWATWCQPCYQEFEHENALVEKFANDSVAIINICIDSEPVKWKEVVSEYELKILNLTASGNWNNLLKVKFDINALPQSVLINQNGKVVCNKCPKPSQGIEAKIKTLLKK